MTLLSENRRVPILMAVGIAAVLMMLPPIAGAQRLGRLFSTPDERALLDELRREQQIVEPEPQAEEVFSDTPSVEHVTINGIVLRSDGADSAWINGRQVDAGARTRDGVRVDTSATRGGRVRITLPSGAETVDLKPGQKIDVESGVVVEAYERSSGSRPYTVFDRVSADAERNADTKVDSAPPEKSSVQRQTAPAMPDSIQYPEALLERIRRSLQGN